jgi:hypothetical protein
MSTTLIVPREVAAKLLDRACATCRHSHKDPDGDLVCRRHPPTAFLAPVPTPMGQMALKAFSSFPIIRPDFTCGEWTQRGNGPAA